jgi:hypothetical protein
MSFLKIKFRLNLISRYPVPTLNSVCPMWIMEIGTIKSDENEGTKIIIIFMWD